MVRGGVCIFTVAWVVAGGLVDSMAQARTSGGDLAARMSVDSNGGQANAASSTAAISADGRSVAFVSGANNGCFDVFVRDGLAGDTKRVSVDSSGNEGDGDSTSPALSADGRFV